MSFNTSHVTLYLYSAQRGKWNYHTFQYISCYSLSTIRKTGSYRKPRFNTSHVTLYRAGFVKCPFHSGFQYISCYSLSRKTRYTRHVLRVSIHLMLLFILLRLSVLKRFLSFNTSHVTLYLEQASRQTGVRMFQYISCYSLSKPCNRRSIIGVLFQYISCYSLS